MNEQINEAGETDSPGTSGINRPANPAASHPLTSESLGHQPNEKTGSVRIKIDGTVKSINQPVTGADLHRLAGAIEGYPVKLKSGGSEVPNNAEPFDVKTDQEFTTK